MGIFASRIEDYLPSNGDIERHAAASNTPVSDQTQMELYKFLQKSFDYIQSNVNPGPYSLIIDALRRTLEQRKLSIAMTTEPTKPVKHSGAKDGVWYISAQLDYRVRGRTTRRGRHEYYDDRTGTFSKWFTVQYDTKDEAMTDMAQSRPRWVDMALQITQETREDELQPSYVKSSASKLSQDVPDEDRVNRYPLIIM